MPYPTLSREYFGRTDYALPISDIRLPPVCPLHFPYVVLRFDPCVDSLFYRFMPRTRLPGIPIATGLYR